MKYSLVIVAAGSSVRFGQGHSKMLYRFPDGKTVIERTLDIFLKDEQCSQIVVAVNQEVMEFFKGRNTVGRVVFCQGGSTRQESVHNALMAVREDYVLVHDGARCFVSNEDVTRLVSVLDSHTGAILAARETDTVKLVQDDLVVETLDRTRLLRAQTPQGFPTEQLLECYRKADEEGYQATDDSQLFERYGDGRVKVIISSCHNTKITTIEDVKEND